MAFWFACYPPGHGSPPRSIPAARAYEVLRELLLELMQAKDTLTIVQPVAPDDERGWHMATIQVARAALETFL